MRCIRGGITHTHRRRRDMSNEKKNQKVISIIMAAIKTLWRGFKEV